MKKLLLFLSFALVLSGLKAQSYNLQLTLENASQTKVYLSRFYKTTYSTLDSTTLANGSCYFVKGEMGPSAMYRVDFGQAYEQRENNSSPFIEFVWGEESFSITADYTNIRASISFDNSAENDLLMEFRPLQDIYRQKKLSFLAFIDAYPDEDPSFKVICNEFDRVQKAYGSRLNSLVNSSPKLFTSHIIEANREVHIPPELYGPKRNSYIKEHYFDQAIIDDPALLYAPVYTSKMIDYLMYYRNPDYSFSEQEKAFQDAVDIIMVNTSGDLELRSFVVDYLLEGFNSFGMEELQTYIVETYLDESCESDASELARERVEGYREMAIGKVAADILIRDEHNDMQRLSEVESDYTLVVFWASYCQHCRRMMPRLKEWYENERPLNLEVFAISIDSVKNEWESFSEKLDPPWINTHEATGWEGKSAADYNIYATPTMFLLDHERKIIAKPVNMKDIRKVIEDI